MVNPLRWPVAVKVTAIGVLAAGVGGGAALAASSSHTPAPNAASSTPATIAPSPPAASTQPYTAPTPDTSGDCLFAASGADIQVGIGNPTQSCDQWVQALAGSGLNWYPITVMNIPGSQTSDYDTMQESCDLTDGTQELYVIDGGSEFYGNDICSSEEQNGWSPEGTPGPLAQAGQDAAQSAAAASASAAAAQQEQNALNNESTADGQLNSDVAGMKKDYSSWSTDVGTANTDYQRVKAEPLCSGGTTNQTTYDDAQSVYDDGQSVYDDESNLTNDISSVNGDISSLQGDQSAAGNTNYGGDITAAQSVVKTAQGAVNANESNAIQSEATAIQTAADNCS